MLLSRIGILFTRIILFLNGFYFLLILRLYRLLVLHFVIGKYGNQSNQQYNDFIFIHNNLKKNARFCIGHINYLERIFITKT
ncbi:Uncharacterised protein [Mycobacteroides abscessus subsp. massiliense]|nr:Uncharacterised protein [Mycobacteroides abscessus subsp. massiliense]